MIQQEDIVCISSIDWDFIWQSHQQIMSTLADKGNRVLFVETTGVRRPSLHDVPRVIKRFRNWLRGTRAEREKLYVYSPLVLPFPYSRMAERINCRIVARAIRRWMSAAGIQHPIIWTFLPTSLTLDLIRALEPELVVYYCTDDFQASSHSASNIRRTEHPLFREADIVFVTSERLMNRARQFRNQVDIFPSAVDFERFESARQSADGIPRDLASIPRPIIGYVGGLHRQLDQELVAMAASRMPEASFVFIGPEQCDLSKIRKEPTVHVLGARPHHQLPAYIKGFDVGIVPYVLSEYTSNVYPSKINEYLAMGIPIVSTSIPEVERFNVKHGNVIGVAHDGVAFVQRLHDALNQQSETERQRRIAIARENSWSNRLELMTSIIADALSARRTKPVA